MSSDNKVLDNELSNNSCAQKILDGSDINLPNKYYLALFPETRELLGNLNKEIEEIKAKKSTVAAATPMVEEYRDINDILDKLSRNNYDRACLTKKELEILSQN